MRVRIYRNLHTGGYSIQARIASNHRASGGWRVVAHASHVSVADACGVVMESGRQRVIREKRKNVHAFIEGELIQFDGVIRPMSVWLTESESRELESVAKEWKTIPRLDYVLGYNPYKNERFTIAEYGGMIREIRYADSFPGIVVCIPSGIYATIK